MTPYFFFFIDYDTGDGSIVIDEIPSVRVVYVNQAMLIDATETSTSGLVDILLSIDNGDTFEEIASGVSLPYGWTPSSGQLSTEAVLRIRDSADALITDDSALFTITSLSTSGGGTGDATLENQLLILEKLDSLAQDQLTAITLEMGVIGNFPKSLTIGDSYTSNTGRIKVILTSDDLPVTSFGDLQLEDALIEFIAFRPNDSAIIAGTCVYHDDVTETYVMISIPSSETVKGKAGYTYEGRLKFHWDGDDVGSVPDDEQKTFSTGPFKFLANP